jgi:hypothetical protein
MIPTWFAISTLHINVARRIISFSDDLFPNISGGRRAGIELFGSSAARHFRKLTEMVGFADALLLIASYTMV